MAVFARQEDEADRWLREHDPYYTDSRNNKRVKYSYPYETPEQEHRRAQWETPISNLSKAQMIQFAFIAGAFDENGNFEL